MGVNTTCKDQFSFWDYVIFISEGEDAQNINQSRQYCLPESTAFEIQPAPKRKFANLSSTAVTDEINVLFV